MDVVKLEKNGHPVSMINEDGQLFVSVTDLNKTFFGDKHFSYLYSMLCSYRKAKKIEDCSKLVKVPSGNGPGVRTRAFYPLSFVKEAANHKNGEGFKRMAQWAEAVEADRLDQNSPETMSTEQVSRVKPMLIMSMMSRRKTAAG